MFLRLIQEKRNSLPSKILSIWCWAAQFLFSQNKFQMQHICWTKKLHIKFEENMPEKSKEIVTYIATTVLIKARISPSCIKHRIQQKLVWILQPKWRSKRRVSKIFYLPSQKKECQKNFSDIQLAPWIHWMTSQNPLEENIQTNVCQMTSN